MVRFNFNDNNAIGGIGKMGGKPSQRPKLNVSFNEIRDLVLRYKVEAGCAAGVLLTGIVVGLFVVGQMEKMNALDNEIHLLSAKEQPAFDIKKFSQEEQSITGGLPARLPENRFITHLTALANKHNVIITSITPPESRNAGFFQRSSTQLACLANNFGDVLLFLDGVEQAEYALKVDYWSVHRSVSPGPDRRMAVTNDKTLKLDIVMVVSSIEIMDNEKKQRKK